MRQIRYANVTDSANCAIRMGPACWDEMCFLLLWIVWSSRWYRLATNITTVVRLVAVTRALQGKLDTVTHSDETRCQSRHHKRVSQSSWAHQLYMSDVVSFSLPLWAETLKLFYLWYTYNSKFLNEVRTINIIKVKFPENLCPWLWGQFLDQYGKTGLVTSRYSDQ